MEWTFLLEGWLFLDMLSPKILIRALALIPPLKEGEILPPGFCFCLRLTEPPKENDLRNYSYYRQQ